MKKAVLIIAALSVVLFSWSDDAYSKGKKKQEDDDEGQKLKMADRDQEFVKKVNTAVRRGSDFLLSQQQKDGSWTDWFDTKEGFVGGPTAIALLACLKSGVNRFNEKITKAFNYLRKLPPKKTYVVGLTLMALAAFYNPPKPVKKSAKSSESETEKWH